MKENGAKEVVRETNASVPGSVGSASTGAPQWEFGREAKGRKTGAGRKEGYGVHRLFLPSRHDKTSFPNASFQTAFFPMHSQIFLVLARTHRKSPTPGIVSAVSEQSPRTHWHALRPSSKLFGRARKKLAEAGCIPPECVAVQNGVWHRQHTLWHPGGVPGEKDRIPRHTTGFPPCAAPGTAT